jgi:hypothetical protein
MYRYHIVYLLMYCRAGNSTRILIPLMYPSIVSLRQNSEQKRMPSQFVGGFGPLIGCFFYIDLDSETYNEAMIRKKEIVLLCYHF